MTIAVLLDRCPTLARHALAIGLVAGVSASVEADPGFVTGGGQPQLVSGKTTVRMTREKVLLIVRADRVDVDGTFEFANLGKACNVRMGFPENASFPLGGKTPTTVFGHYRAYVDGKKVKSRLLTGPTKRDQWDVQSVSFASNGRRTVRIQYSTSLGGLVGKPPMALTQYVLHTGGTWNGPIGSVVVDVRLSPDTELASPFDVLYARPESISPSAWESQPAKSGGIIATGPTAPSVHGDTLRFEAKNLKPSQKDDILIVFRYPPKQLAKISKPGATTPVVPKG